MLKKCKTVDVPAVNSAIGNIPKALQKYVGFNGMDSEYCDRIGELMDRAQPGVWILKSYTIKLKFIQLIPIKVMHWMWESSLIILK